MLSRSASPAVVHAHDRLGDRLRVGARGDRAVDALLDQLGGGVVLARDHDARRPARGRLHDHHAVALAARGKQHAQRAAHLGVDRLGVGEAGRRDDLLQPVLGDRRVQRRALGAVAEELAPQPLDPLRRARSPRPPSVACFSGISRPANSTTGSAGARR